VHHKVLSNHPTYRPYMKKSVRSCTENTEQATVFRFKIAVLSE